MEKSFNRLRKPGARAAFVEAEVITSLAHQIRVLRLRRNWTQLELAKKLGSTQAVVSRLEDPSYGKTSIQTLLKLGTVFDVALNIRFGSLVKFFNEAMQPSRTCLEVDEFEKEAEWVGFHDELKPLALSSSNESSSGYFYMSVDTSAQRTSRMLFDGVGSFAYFFADAGSRLKSEDIVVESK